MIHTNAFDYINVLEKAADASWARNNALASNIANVDTPNYKRVDVSFEEELARALHYNKFEPVDKKVSDFNKKHSGDFKFKTYVDDAELSYRLDGNNVDIDTENVYLAENQLKYQGLLAGINQEFTNLQAVMK